MHIAFKKLVLSSVTNIIHFVNNNTLLCISCITPCSQVMPSLFQSGGGVSIYEHIIYHSCILNLVHCSYDQHSSVVLFLFCLPFNT